MLADRWEDAVESWKNSMEGSWEMLLAEKRMKGDVSTISGLLLLGGDKWIRTTGAHGHGGGAGSTISCKNY